MLAWRALVRIGSTAASAQVGNSVTFCADVLHALLDGMSPGLLTKVPTGALRPVYALIEQVRMPSAALAPLPYAARCAQLVKSFQVRAPATRADSADDRLT